MIQFDTELVKIGDIPVRIVHPIRKDRTRCVVFYHGWSSCSELQMTRALVLAAHGYTVLLPDSIFHGSRGMLPDYYSVEVYGTFWETIFRNIDEFSEIGKWLHEHSFSVPWVMGHSMGGLTVIGLAAQYPKGIRGAVSFNGSGDWLLTHLFIQARFGVAEPRDWPVYEEIDKKSPMHCLQELKNVPVFMTNGEADPSIDPRAQAHFAEALSKAGGHGVHITYPGLAHFVTTNMLDDALAWMASQEKEGQEWSQKEY